MAVVSTKGRYALRVMVDMAEHRRDGYIPLKEIAERQGISEKYLESILKTLVRAREPSGYTVGEILRLTEDSLAPVACLEEGAAVCPRAGECRTLKLWKGLNDVLTGYLDSVTVADLMAPAQTGDNYVI